MLNRIKHYFPIFIFAIIILITTYFLPQYSYFRTEVEMRALDILFWLRGPLPSPDDIVIVFIDEPAMEQLPYRVPIPRDHLAKLIEVLSNNGAKVIVVDVFLDKRTDEERDKKLRDAIEKAGNVAVVSELYLQKDSTYCVQYLPHPYFNSVVAGVGHSNIISSRGMGSILSVREMPVLLRTKDGISLSISLVAYLLANNINIDYAKKQINSTGSLKFLSIPTEKDFSAFINFVGPSSWIPSSWTQYTISTPTFKCYGSSVVQTGVLPAEWFKDKIVFIGTGLDDAPDMFITPFYGSNMPKTFGVEIHANALNTLIRKNFIILLKDYFRFILLLLFITATTLITIRFNLLIEVIYLIVITISFIALSIYLFSHYNIYIYVVSPLIAIFLSYFITNSYQALTQEKQKKRIKNMFQYYVSPAVVEDLIKNPDMLKLGGVEEELSVLFSDIQGFTTISERLKPAELVEFLNKYLTAMTDIIIKNGGTVDKYEGDAIMAFFGAPVKQPDNARRICLSALEMQNTLSKLREEWKQQGFPEIIMRIGINTGKMIVGNVGSKGRFNYTVMGDSVNLASRLEGANKQYGTHIMISEFTYKYIKDDFICRKLDNLKVKGKNEPVQVYQLIATNEEGISDTMKNVLENYNKGLQAYFNKEWDVGISYFEKALEINPDDTPSMVYLERCKKYKSSPPSPDWDGTYKMETK